MEKVFVARWYHLIWYPDWFRRLHQRPESFLGGLVKPGMVAADIGCGLGFYSVELAKMVGEGGRVLAVDFQPQMLRLAKRKAKKAGLSARIEFVECSQDDLKVREKVDFVLSMWVAHEVEDRDRFFGQIRNMLKPEGRYLLAEPKLHVKRPLYERICEDAEAAGLRRICEAKVGASYAAVFVVAEQGKD